MGRRRTSAQPADAAEVAVAATRQAKASIVEDARRDPAIFNAFVLKNEETGAPIDLAPMHVAWQDLISEHDRLVLWAHTEAGKTNQISIGRTLYEIGKDPTLRTLVLSNTDMQAVKIGRAIRGYVETSDDLHWVFPKLKPAAGGPWTDHEMTVERPTIAKDPTIQCKGVHGAVTGARLDLVIVDDILDYENTLTADQMKKLLQWWDATIVGRLTDRARVIVVGTAWHPDDFLHEMAARWGHAFRYPVLDDHGQIRWPEQWSHQRLEKRRVELGPLEFARQMLCVPRDDTAARFKREWIDKAIRAGEGKDYAYALRSVPAGCRTYTGVDLAVSKKSSADETVFFSIIVHGDQRRELLEIKAGRWHGPEIVQGIRDVYQRFECIPVVENVAAQQYIVDFASDIPCKTFTTGKGEASLDFEAEKLAAELAAGRWIIPSRGGRVPPEVEKFVRELLWFDPKAHTGDRLAACLFARHEADTPPPETKRFHMDLLRR